MLTLSEITLLPYVWLTLIQSLHNRLQKQPYKQESSQAMTTMPLLTVEENRASMIFNDWNDHRVGADIICYMNGYNDPRREKMLTTVKVKKLLVVNQPM